MTIDTYHVLLALIIGLFSGGIAGYIGSLMVSKRMALVGGALGHLALPGTTIALLYHFDVSLGALLFLSIGVIAIWLLERRTHLSFEALTAVIFSISLAITFLFLPEKEFDVALFGDISKLSLEVTIATCLVAIVIFIFTKRIFKHIILGSISQDLAKVEKINIGLENFFYLVCIGLTVALGVRIVGGLMMASLMAIPAATSNNVSSSLFQYAYISLLLGSISCFLGIIFSVYLNLPIGSSVILSGGFLFFISLFFKKN
jgi:zinc transport system permease protein